MWSMHPIFPYFISEIKGHGHRPGLSLNNTVQIACGTIRIHGGGSKILQGATIGGQLAESEPGKLRDFISHQSLDIAVQLVGLVRSQ